jgi:hypothetical protein
MSMRSHVAVRCSAQMMVSCASVFTLCSPAVRESEIVSLKENINLLKFTAAVAGVLML